MFKQVLIAYRETNSGAEILGEHTFAPVNDSPEARLFAKDCLMASAYRMEAEAGLRTSIVTLFGTDEIAHAAKLAAARERITER